MALFSQVERVWPQVGLIDDVDSAFRLPSLDGEVVVKEKVLSSREEQIGVGLEILCPYIGGEDLDNAGEVPSDELESDSSCCCYCETLQDLLIENQESLPVTALLRIRLHTKKVVTFLMSLEESMTSYCNYC
jgi:hypothetical protein